MMDLSYIPTQRDILAGGGSETRAEERIGEVTEGGKKKDGGGSRPTDQSGTARVRAGPSGKKWRMKDSRKHESSENAT
jgi:hypothetical protein